MHEPFGVLARASTAEKDLTAQHDGLLSLGIQAEHIYVDHGLTGTSRARPGLGEAMAAVRRGDTLMVSKLDRLTRSLPDDWDIADELTAKGVAPSLSRTPQPATDPPVAPRPGGGIEVEQRRKLTGKGAHSYPSARSSARIRAAAAAPTASTTLRTPSHSTRSLAPGTAYPMRRPPITSASLLLSAMTQTASSPGRTARRAKSAGPRHKPDRAPQLGDENLHGGGWQRGGTRYCRHQCEHGGHDRSGLSNHPVATHRARITHQDEQQVARAYCEGEHRTGGLRRMCRTGAPQQVSYRVPSCGCQ